MAVSKKRDKRIAQAPKNVHKEAGTNPAWLVPTAVTLLVLGPAWIVVYYITRANYPLPIGDWNLVIGFVFMAASMALFTRWK